ncbi:M48 family metallopeptidase [Chitinophaga niabensis]|uniref:Peptidase family M48 n=1 Tax=Chitinophaga niabensis TaxID=536979 RepID=A0A1N6DII8_9BACT|nr:M48 family metallopeptidase [Chitinophaga niabensis]SIN70615.1 Peptidase family M48 [Chitinophaga niabensis]
MFPGKYYDHQTAQAIPANIQLFVESLQLELPGGKKLHWLFTEITVEVVDRNFIRITAEGTLEVNDPVFVKTFLQKYKYTRSAGLHQLALRGGLKATLIVLLVIAGILLSGHFYVLPWCVNRVVDRLPLSFDKELGDLAAQSIHETSDPAGSQILRNFAHQIQWDTQDTLSFSIVKSDIENAYALPGGRIVVYTGLLEKLHTSDQLAALLSHEVAHVTHRHSVKKLCRDMSTTMLVSIALGSAGGATNTLYANASSLYSLTYSRQYEQEADLMGMETLRRNHINQLGMLQLMQVLQQLDQQTNIPEFVRTHPLTDNRVNYVRKGIAEHPAAFKKNAQMEELFRQLRQRYSK